MTSGISLDSSSPRGSKSEGKSAERSDRSASIHSADICRICHCDVAEGNPESNLIAPCYCSGSLRFVHPECLQLWIKASDIKSCELCHFAFIMHTKTKPFSQWDRLDMSTLERRKVLCSVTFHVVAITCVVWSLYVLIDRTAEEARANHLEWSFWTKLIVVAVGFTGGVVFMYVQCKTYVQLFKKWRAFNRVICVQNAPEKVKPPPPAPAPAIERSTAMIVDEKVRAGSTTPPPPVTHVSVAVISDPPPATDDDLEAAPVDVHARNSDNDNDDDGDGDGDGDEHEQQAPLVIAPLDVSPV